MRAFWEARVGCIVAAGGIGWAVQIATTNYTGWEHISFPSGPMETCAIGILIWLHAKWRDSVRVQ